MEPTNNNYENNPYPTGPEPLPPQQPMAPQQPVQPVAYQQLIMPQQPVQPMQPVPTSYDNIAYTNPAPKKNKNFLIIIILAIVCLVAIGGGLIFAMLNKQSASTPTPAPTPDKPVGKTKFEDLTKEEALAFLATQKNARGIIPDNYVEDEVANATSSERSGFGLIPWSSYSSLDELDMEASNLFYQYLVTDTDTDTDADVLFYQIEEYDYYAIIKPTKDPAECYMIENCNSYLSFKRDYIDSEANSAYSSSSITFSDYKYYLKVNNKELADKLLRTYSVASIYHNGLMNIYDYEFEETDDKYILTIHFIMPGENFSNLMASTTYSTENLAINLFNGIVSADKTTGLITSNLTDSSMLNDIVNVFPLTSEDIERIPSYSIFHEMYDSNTSNDEGDDYVLPDIDIQLR